MRDFFQNLGYKISVFMQGRYGRDKLYNVLSICAVICIILSFFPPLRFFIYIALALLIWSMFRTLSRNIPARKRELEAFEKLFRSVTGFFRVTKDRWKYKDTHIYVKCPSCKTYIRLKKPPKGKTIRISCPRCKHTIEKRT